MLSTPWILIFNFCVKVRTTPHVSGSVNPVWESVVEFMVKDFTKVRASCQEVNSLGRDAKSFSQTFLNCVTWYVMYEREYSIFGDPV